MRNIMYKILNGNYLNAEDEHGGVVGMREERCNMDTWRHINMDSQPQDHV
jgi:hypothetical protein